LLSPYKGIFVSLTLVLLSIKVYQQGLTRNTFTSLFMSILLIYSEDLVASYNQGLLSLSLFKPSCCDRWITTYSIQGLKCEGCAEKVKTTLESHSAVAAALVHYRQGWLQVTSHCDEEKIPDHLIQSILGQIDFNYRIYLLEQHNECV
jgi:copper chaperone CopZ